MNIGSIVFLILYIHQSFAEILNLFHFKTTLTSYTDDVRDKVPSFKKSHILLNMKKSTKTLSIHIFVCLKMLLTAAIQDE